MGIVVSTMHLVTNLLRHHADHEVNEVNEVYGRADYGQKKLLISALYMLKCYVWFPS